MVNKSILDNGIRVVSETLPYVHSVSIGIWVTSGSRHESLEMNGVTHFIEHLMFKGTARRSSLDIAREIDAVGGVLNAFTGREYVCYYAKVLSSHLRMAVDLLADIFLNSKFDTMPFFPAPALRAALRARCRSPLPVASSRHRRCPRRVPRITEKRPP